MHILKHPLSSWVLALCVTVALPVFQLFSGGFLSAGIKPPHTENQPDTTLHGLIITSSGLHCALKNKKSHDRNNEIHLQSIYLPLASVSSFRGVEAAIGKAAPDFIVVQGSALVNNRKTTTARHWMRQLKRYWIVTLSGIHPSVESTFIKLQCALQSLDKKRWSHWVKQGTDNRSNPTSEDLNTRIEFINTLLEFNKPVFIVNQPHPQMAQSYKTVVNNAVARIIKSADAPDNVHQLDYTVVHRDSQFFDPYHPTPELTSIYIPWFNSRVIGQLQQ